MKNPFVTNGYAGSEHFCDRILNVLYSRTETGKKGDEGEKKLRLKGQQEYLLCRMHKRLHCSKGDSICESLLSRINLLCVGSGVFHIQSDSNAFVNSDGIGLHVFAADGNGGDILLGEGAGNLDLVVFISKP